MTTPGPIQPPSEIRTLAHRVASSLGPCRHWLAVGGSRTCPPCVADAVLAAVFGQAYQVVERPDSPPCDSPRLENPPTVPGVGPLDGQHRSAPGGVAW